MKSKPPAPLPPSPSATATAFTPNPAAPPPPDALDAVDLRLLAQLQADAARSNLELAAAVHVSPATALRRVRRLRDAGYIERTVALLSPDKLGAGLTAVVEITLDRQGDELI
ncbi:MAG: Lrp/AsnC family transcriptional regulator, partial [Betaproteobacteria bacterium]|nr:Lrp/AsnC family transcriptional regulator [Betaproteobacteria bacterium]